MFGRGRTIPGNRRVVTDVAYEAPAWELGYVYGLHGGLVANMHEHDGLRAGYGAGGDFGGAGLYEHGAARAADGTPNPLYAEGFPVQAFTGAEAFRLQAKRSAERRDYRGEVEAAVFKPLGAL